MHGSRLLATKTAEAPSFTVENTVRIKGDVEFVLMAILDIVRYITRRESKVEISLKCKSKIPTKLLKHIERAYGVEVESNEYNTIRLVKPKRIMYEEEDFDSVIESWKW